MPPSSTVSSFVSPVPTAGASTRCASCPPRTSSRQKSAPRAASPDMNERRVAAVTEPMRDERVDVTPVESRSVRAVLSSTLVRRAMAAGAGALVACSFAPLNWWPLAVLCPAVLMWLWQGVTPREGAWLGFWFNAGTFAAGTYWLYISIRIFGEAPLWVAFMLMLA